jgi:hypothetical protein
MRGLALTCVVMLATFACARSVVTRHHCPASVTEMNVRVLDPHGNPAPQATLFILHQERDFRTDATTNSGGLARITVPEGRYRIWIELGPLRRTVETMVRAECATELVVYLELM